MALGSSRVRREGAIPRVGSPCIPNNAGLHLLQNISLLITPGELIGIAGAVGSGKSSLLAGLLGEMASSIADIERQGNIKKIPK